MPVKFITGTITTVIRMASTHKNERRALCKYKSVLWDKLYLSSVVNQ